MVPAITITALPSVGTPGEYQITVRMTQIDEYDRQFAMPVYTLVADIPGLETIGSRELWINYALRLITRRCEDELMRYIQEEKLTIRLSDGEHQSFLRVGLAQAVA